LRDRAIVLADLSLENPNVFYELGNSTAKISIGKKWKKPSRR
jgi:precorrin-6B methylase 2